MNCGTCKHAVARSGGAMPVFDCRRYPPQVHAVGNGHGTVTRFPRVEAHTCCGEYKRAAKGAGRA